MKIDLEYNFIHLILLYYLLIYFIYLFCYLYITITGVNESTKDWFYWK